MRSVQLVAAVVASLSMAGCAGSYAKAGPVGLSYRCNDGDVRIVYDGQGFLPGLTVRRPYAGAEARLQPRAMARLRYRGVDHPLMADWTVAEGLRYRSLEPIDDDFALIWRTRGEEAWIDLVPVREGVEPRALEHCARIRTVEGAPAETVAATPH